MSAPVSLQQELDGQKANYDRLKELLRQKQEEHTKERGQLRDEVQELEGRMRDVHKGLRDEMRVLEDEMDKERELREAAEWRVEELEREVRRIRMRS